MYLKRLDIQGFKSFANKTLMEFGAGVTCVVGPNGTGKTNVADALRWVLGEHVSRAIRARKTEDVIFAGSDARAPMGFAEVAITLDNATAWLPIDFSEVTVSRRAYRSGENEYFINSARVRLRDVVELFMRAQVGQNSYAFMGQGMVEQALSLRPEDRRALIEEAADVRIYRNKLEDARSKLKGTRENVERVRLLLREIEPRINQLERQAGRAARYQELTRELAATLQLWYEHQWHEVNAQLLAAVTSHDQCERALKEARADARAREDGLGQLRAAIDERRGEIDARSARLRSLEDYVRDLERRADVDDARARMLADRTRELTSEIEGLEGDLAELPESVVLDSAELQARVEEARAALGQERDRFARAEQEVVALNRGALTDEHAAARARALADESRRRAAELTNEAARLRREQEAADTERRRALHALAEWARAYAATLAEAAAARSELDRSSGRREALAELAARAETERDTVAAELRDITTRAEVARLRMELIERIDVHPQPPDAGVRAILEAGGLIKRTTVPEDVELRGVRGLVGQVVRVPNGLERAIEAALGDYLYAVVFEREADMREAVALLLGGDAGRATMFALDRLQDVRPLNLIKERGVVGVASALVKVDGRYRRLIDTLLGRTVVVESLAVAERYMRRGLAHAVATTDGVLLRPIGSVSVGAMADAEAAMVYARETADIPQEFESLSGLAAEKQSSVTAAEARLREAQSRRNAFEESLDVARDRVSRAVVDAASARAGLATLAARLRALHVDAHRRVADVDKLAAAAAAAAAEQGERLREALAAEEREGSARRSLAEIETVRARLTEAITEQAATVAHLEGELRSERKLTGGDRVTRDRLRRLADERRQQLARLAEEVRDVTSRLDAARRELQAKSVETSALREELEPARRELAQFESRERSLSAELVEANALVRDAERSLMEAEHEAKVREEELQSLRVSLESEGFATTHDGDVVRMPEPALVARAATDEDGAPPRWLRSDDERGVPPIRGGATIDVAEVRDRIADLRAQIRTLGPINEQAAVDYDESRERYDFLSAQLADLSQAESQLNEAIDELETVIRDRFRQTFRVVNKEFERYFSAFFRGGTARLELGETDDDGLPGVEIYAQPPGKKLGSLALLSGGERSLTAVALLFALLSANPSPICVLDEVDAALDEANVGRFVDELTKLAEKTQFVIITHNRRTIEMADTIYGVSMGADSVSRVLSLKLSDIPRDGAG